MKTGRTQVHRLLLRAYDLNPKGAAKGPTDTKTGRTQVLRLSLRVRDHLKGAAKGPTDAKTGRTQEHRLLRRACDLNPKGAAKGPTDKRRCRNQDLRLSWRVREPSPKGATKGPTDAKPSPLKIFGCACQDLRLRPSKGSIWCIGRITDHTALGFSFVTLRRPLVLISFPRGALPCGARTRGEVRSATRRSHSKKRH